MQDRFRKITVPIPGITVSRDGQRITIERSLAGKLLLRVLDDMLDRAMMTDEDRDRLNGVPAGTSAAYRAHEESLTDEELDEYNRDPAGTAAAYRAALRAAKGGRS